jgi:hypothetical protein
MGALASAALGHLLVVVVIIAVVAAALSCGSCIGFVILACLRGRCGVPCTTFCGPSALVRQAEELCDILDVMCGKLLQHLLIPHTLVKCNHSRCIGDMSFGVANLREMLDEGTHSPPPQALLYGMEVNLIARSRVSTLEVGRELVA